MQERLIAFFASREAAEKAADALRRAHIPPAAVQVLQAEADASFDPKGRKAAKQRRETPGLLDAIRNLLAETGLLDARRAVSVDDVGRNCFEEGVCRGGTVLRVEVDTAQAQETMNVLARHDALDITEYAASWTGTRKRATTSPTAAKTVGADTDGKTTRAARSATGTGRKRTGKTAKASSEAVAVQDAAVTDPFNEITPEMRERMIAEAAYLAAEQRGFSGDLALQDWLEAERRVDARLRSGRKAEGSSVS